MITVVRTIYSLVILLSTVAMMGILLLLWSKDYVYKHTPQSRATSTESIPFPVGVNPQTETISEIDSILSYREENLANAHSSTDTWWKKLVMAFSSKAWYQNLASPVSRIIVIWPGERKEEAATNIGDVLGWSDRERTEFLELIVTSEPILKEGKFYPGQYVVHKGATPYEVALLIYTEFTDEVLGHYSSEVAAVVPLKDALIIASLLEREASDFENMRQVSGVIWNRLFADMPLQLDATLQYARGSQPNESTWWPVPAPADKFIDSPYNTYANVGLPPDPISNPSSDTILAALNPIKTDCYYYFHDDDQSYHCSATYEEHVDKLKAAYGRGQ